jgi:hypothetical protein
MNGDGIRVEQIVGQVMAGEYRVWVTKNATLDALEPDDADLWPRLMGDIAVSLSLMGDIAVSLTSIDATLGIIADVLRNLSGDSPL